MPRFAAPSRLEPASGQHQKIVPATEFLPLNPFFRKGHPGIPCELRGVFHAINTNTTKSCFPHKHQYKRPIFRINTNTIYKRLFNKLLLITRSSRHLPVEKNPLCGGDPHTPFKGARPSSSRSNPTHQHHKRRALRPLREKAGASMERQARLPAFDFLGRVAMISP